MKKYYLTAMALVIVLAISLIGYGIFVNYEGESVIMDRMNNRAIVVSGAQAQQRSINAQYEFEQATMGSRQSADVIAKVDGVISNLRIHKNMPLAAGDVVADLTNEDIPLKIRQAESNMKRAQALELQARNSYNRYQSLINQNATSMEKVDEARANYEAAEANMADAQAQYDQAVLNNSRLQVTTNIPGNVLITYQHAGNYVTAGTPICLVGDFRAMWFAINMEDGDLQSLLGSQGEGAEFTLSFKRPDFVKSYSTEYQAGNHGRNTVFNVKIYGIYPELGQPADMRRVVFDVYNPSGVLEARSYEHMVLTSSQPRNVLAIPVEALDNNNNHSDVFVVNGENRLEKRSVRVGAINDRYAEILEGIQLGETVVVSGINGLREGQLVSVNMEDI